MQPPLPLPPSPSSLYFGDTARQNKVSHGVNIQEVFCFSWQVDLCGHSVVLWKFREGLGCLNPSVLLVLTRPDSGAYFNAKPTSGLDHIAYLIAFLLEQTSTQCDVDEFRF